MAAFEHLVNVKMRSITYFVFEIDSLFTLRADTVVTGPFASAQWLRAAGAAVMAQLSSRVLYPFSL